MRIAFLTIISFFMVTLCQAQYDLSSDVTFLNGQLNNHRSKPEYPIEKGESNEIKIGVQLFFLFYKNYLSSQDTRTCAFSPSCSTYCLHSVQRRGVLKGLMGAFDRLSRCNHLSPENYQINRETGQLIDPVE
ncbi:MAG: membrane protein insertion efficiency factor YidD [Saprospiraceae bacterium]|nr:membrane protein insertion efficiency factor YidD [Saprospiraceae bacterium]